MNPLLLLLSLTSAAAAEGLSLDQALASAAVHNADLRAANASLDAREAELLAARGAFDPALRGSAGRDYSESRAFLAGYPTSSTTTAGSADAGLSGELATGTSWSLSAELAQQRAETESSLGGVSTAQETDIWTSSLGLSLRQDLLSPLRPTEAQQAVRRAAERADQEALAALEARQTALAAVAEAWWTWSAAVDRRELARRSAEAARALEQVTAAWVSEGQAEAVELARVQTERLAAELDAAEAESEALRAGDALLVVIGRAPGADITPAGDGAPPPLGSAELAPHLAAAQASNPEIRRLDLQLQAARAAARDARAEGLPSLSATGSAGLAALDTSASGAIRDLGSADALPSWAAGVELSMPIGGRASRGARRAASAEVIAAEIALDAAQRGLDADVRAALRDVETAETALRLAGERVTVARQAEALERARAEEGLRRLDQLLDAVEAADEAEQDLLEARLSAWRAAVQVARLEGGVETLLRP